jgi:hypothetical protein
MANLVRNVFQGPCVDQVPGKCDQFHNITFSLTPCAVPNGVITVNCGLQCDEPSIIDPFDCGFNGVPQDNVYALRFLTVKYNACPVSTSYGLDPSASFLRLYVDVQRLNTVSRPLFYGSTMYGRAVVQPSSGAFLQSTTLNRLDLFRRDNPDVFV